MSIAPDTLALIDWPASVFCGANCPLERVNWEYCGDHNVPVIRTAVLGASYFYRQGDAMYAALVTRRHISQRAWLDAVCETLGASVPGLFVEDNDLRLGNTRCGMSAPELQRQDGVWLNLMEVLLHTDLTEARRALAFPDGVWDHKPVSCLEDWIRPLDSVLGAQVAPVVAAALETAAERLYG